MKTSLAVLAAALGLAAQPKLLINAQPDVRSASGGLEPAFRALLGADAEVVAKLGPERLARAFDLEHALAHVPAILESTAYRSGGVLFITWDEAGKGDGPIPMIVLSPFAKGNHYSNAIYYTHSSTLRTLQEIFGVSPLIRYASSLPDLHDLFQEFP